MLIKQHPLRRCTRLLHIIVGRMDKMPSKSESKSEYGVGGVGGGRVQDAASVCWSRWLKFADIIQLHTTEQQSEIQPSHLLYDVDEGYTFLFTRDGQRLRNKPPPLGVVVTLLSWPGRRQRLED